MEAQMFAVIFGLNWKFLSWGSNVECGYIWEGRQEGGQCKTRSELGSI